MSEQIEPELECMSCGDVLNRDEAENPRRDSDGDVICDDCYHENYEFTCCWCEEYEHAGYQHDLLVVFDAKEAFSKYDQDNGFTSGIYRVDKRPYYTSDYINAWLNTYALEKVADLPLPLTRRDTGYACGHLCRECKAKITTEVKP